MVNRIAVREFEMQDLPEVLRLLETALGTGPQQKRSAEWFQWKHIANPFGKSIMLVATAHEQIVGLRAFMRWDLRTPDNDIVRCVRAVDTATHPDYQRRGIFRTLTESALEVAADVGVHMVFNTPNAKSGAGYLKMGWEEVGPIGVMLAPHPLRVFATSDGDTPLLAQPERAVNLNVVDRKPRGLRTPRTRDYLEWRFDGNPNAQYHKVTKGNGLAVLRSNVRNGRPELVISDLFGDDAHHAARTARRLSRAAYLVGWFSKGSPERRAAIRAGIFAVPMLKALTLVVRPIGDVPTGVRSLQTWDLSMGDMELL